MSYLYFVGWVPNIDICACSHHVFAPWGISRTVCVCVWVCRCVCARPPTYAYVCEDYSSSVTTWREATWWERLKQNLILALMWQQHFLSKCRHYLTVEPRHVHVCFARMRALMHAHIHAPPSGYFAGGWSKRDSVVCRLKSPASSQCRSCVLQIESPTFLRLTLETKRYQGGNGLYRDSGRSPLQSLLPSATQVH